MRLYIYMILFLFFALSHAIRLFVIRNTIKNGSYTIVYSMSYEANQKLVNIEILFIGIWFFIGIAMSFYMEVKQREGLQPNSVFTYVAIIAVLISTSVTLPILRRYKSFFRFRKKEIEYNISFDNDSKKAVKISLNNTNNIEISDKGFTFLMNDGKSYFLKRKLLMLLNGYKILFEDIQKLKENLEVTNGA